MKRGKYIEIRGLAIRVREWDKGGRWKGGSAAACWTTVYGKLFLKRHIVLLKYSYIRRQQ